MAENRQEVIDFTATIPASTTSEFFERVKAPGTVEKVFARFYAGQERELQIYMYVRRKGNRDQLLITKPSGTDQYVAGDDDVFEFDTKVKVENDDQIYIRAENTNATYDYTMSIRVAIDYMGGQNRVG